MRNRLGQRRASRGLERAVPAPAVETSANCGAVLRWAIPARGVEILLLPTGGAFVVTDSRTGHVVREGLLEEVDPSRP